MQRNLIPYAHFFAAILAIGWLVPNHYSPWLSAWGDGASIMALIFLAAAILAIRPKISRCSLAIYGIFLLSIGVISIQWVFGKIIYFGDAFMALLYLMLWVVSVECGRNSGEHSQRSIVDTFAIGTMCLALASVGVALIQWTGAYHLSLYIADIPPNGRPFANVAQPNHFCTISFFGLCVACYSYDRKIIGRVGFYFCSVLLILGMVVSQSRTGWLQAAALFIVGVFFARRFESRIKKIELMAGVAFFFVGVLLWPLLSNALLLPSGRKIKIDPMGDARFSHWRAMLDAIWEKPLVGYGWQQAGMAQLDVASKLKAGIYFEHSHNFFLDLLLWNGVPIGFILIALIVFWYSRILLRLKSKQMIWMCAVFAGALIHALLEYPLEYAYFLIPVGFVMGVLDGATVRENKTHPVKMLRFVSVLILAAACMLLAIDYARLEQSFRNLRLASAGIGREIQFVDVKPSFLLTQLNEFQWFTMQNINSSFDLKQLDRINDVADRFPHSAVLFRHAMIFALNGKIDEARKSLQRICLIYSDEKCKEAEAAWGEFLIKNPKISWKTEKGLWPF